MTPFRTIVVTAAAAAIFSGCREASSEVSAAEAAELASREKRLAARIAASQQDVAGGAMLARWVLPADLREISGVALTGDGRVLAHNDQQGRVFVIDPRRGVIVKQFTIGKNMIRADFEGIAVSGADIYLLVSNGIIYRFREGEDGERVPHTQIDTRLGRECEFEGIAIDPASGLFVLPCKQVAKRSLRGHLVIYRWDPQKGGRQQPSIVTIPLDRVVGANGWNDLNPSDITIDPVTKNYILIAGPQKALVELSPGWDVVSSRPLPGVNEQAEGVAITSDGILVLSNEGRTGPGTITLYRWPLQSRSQSLPPVTDVQAEDP